MQIFNFNNNISYNGAADISLKYVLGERKHLLPHTMIRRIRDIVDNNQTPQPTLRELHLDTYSPLLSCKTLDEAKTKFPEFERVKESVVALDKSRSNALKEVKKHISLKDLSLHLLKETWAKLKSQDEIAKELGLADRRKLDQIKGKLRFVNRPINYTTLLSASDPELSAEIARKTREFNKRHPEVMMQRNKRAAQFNKLPERRKAQSELMKKYDQEHPERRQKISEFTQAVWDKAESIKKELSTFTAEHATNLQRNALRKSIESPEKMTDKDQQARKIFYSKFWKSSPESKKRFGEICREVSAERKTQK